MRDTHTGEGLRLKVSFILYISLFKDFKIQLAL